MRSMGRARFAEGTTTLLSMTFAILTGSPSFLVPCHLSDDLEESRSTRTLGLTQLVPRRSEARHDRYRLVCISKDDVIRLEDNGVDLRCRCVFIILSNRLWLLAFQVVVEDPKSNPEVCPRVFISGLHHYHPSVDMCCRISFVGLIPTLGI